MNDADTQRREQFVRRIRRPLAVLAFCTGILLVGHALSLGWYRPGMLAGVPLGQFLPSAQLLLGVVLSSVAVLNRRGDGTPATGVVFAVGVVVFAIGPSSPLAAGLVLWTVIAGVTLFCVGLPALVLAVAGGDGANPGTGLPA